MEKRYIPDSYSILTVLVVSYLYCNIPKKFTSRVKMADSRYFFVPRDNAGKRDVCLSAGESHHLSVVSRVKKGEIVTLLDGCGGIYSARVKRIDSRESLVEIIDSKKAQLFFRPDIAIPIIKANRMNIAVE